MEDDSQKHQQDVEVNKSESTTQTSTTKQTSTSTTRTTTTTTIEPITNDNLNPHQQKVLTNLLNQVLNKPKIANVREKLLLDKRFDTALYELPILQRNLG